MDEIKITGNAAIRRTARTRSELVSIIVHSAEDEAAGIRSSSWMIAEAYDPGCFDFSDEIKERERLRNNTETFFRDNIHDEGISVVFSDEIPDPMVKISRPNCGSYIGSIEEATEELSLCLSEGAPGDSLTFELIEMSPYELSKLPEFKGW